jgi:FMN phosphatase YigB (HAD superfamily)
LVTDLTSQIQLRKLAWLGLDKAFDLVITSEECGGDKCTGKPEILLKRYIKSLPSATWCIGDRDEDHLLQAESLFFKKLPSGRLRQKSEKTFEFSEFQDVLSRIKENSNRPWR